jgi:hypothetical protein
MLKLLAGLLLSLGMVFAGANAAEQKTDCCTKKLACCAKDKACCEAMTKRACCVKAMTCCDKDRGCCASVQECCKEAGKCCNQAKASAARPPRRRLPSRGRAAAAKGSPAAGASRSADHW